MNLFRHELLLPAVIIKPHETGTFLPNVRLCRNIEDPPLVIPSERKGSKISRCARLCEKALFVLRLGSARTANERHFQYLADHPEHGRRVVGYFSHSLALEMTGEGGYRFLLLRHSLYGRVGR